MEAGISNHSSFEWRSIAHARHVVRLDTRWRIGRGVKVRIWEDKWLGYLPTLMVILPPKILDHSSNTWNMPLIESIFHPFELQVAWMLSSLRNGIQLGGSLGCHNVYFKSDGIQSWSRLPTSNFWRTFCTTSLSLVINKGECLTELEFVVWDILSQSFIWSSFFCYYFQIL